MPLVDEFNVKLEQSTPDNLGFESSSVFKVPIPTEECVCLEDSQPLLPSDENLEDPIPAI